HHYASRLRPRAAYVMGRIHQLARIASRAPSLVNLMTGMPFIGRAAKAAAGIAQQRTIPRFASQTFIDWFHARRRADRDGPRVLLWPDTFNNYFRPQTAIAATMVLEATGFQVAVPDQALCCGRPLYDWGWLDRAQRLWRRTLSALKDDITAGTPL